MAIQVQFRRGTSSQNNAFTGAVGEITVDTSDSTLRVHDGTTVGGAIVVTTAATQTLSNKTLASPTITTPTISGNIASLTVTGNVTAGNFVTAGTTTVNSGGAATAIVNGGSNGVGNIGSASTYFNQVFARATTAQYADLAEIYVADTTYQPGTVLIFGGQNEVTMSLTPGDTRIAGVVSTQPAYIMNSACSDDHRTEVALMGKVPTRVTGPVRKGDMMVSAGDGRACACATPAIGSVIGKSLEDFSGDDGVIQIVVGRL